MKHAKLRQDRGRVPQEPSDSRDRVEERLRQLVGHWNGTPFGATMELEWEES
ncbi:MAG: hypothetical protein AAB554_01515 [Patescibacteria group bacterium]